MGEHEAKVMIGCLQTFAECSGDTQSATGTTVLDSEQHQPSINIGNMAV